MIDLKQVWVTQNGVRDIDQIYEMVQYIKDNEYFEWVTRPIIVNDVEGKKFVTDGHHRCLAKVLADKSWLYPEEYILKEYTLDEFKEINIDNGWFTPFNPFTEIRLSNLSLFKEMVHKCRTDIELIKFIESHGHLFKTSRENLTCFWSLANELHII